MNSLYKIGLAVTFMAFVFLTNGWAQTSPTDSVSVVQISGMVVTGDSLAPLGYATVYRVRDSRGTMTDANGFFSIPALPGDTVRVSSLGYIAQSFAVPMDLVLPRMNVVQPLGRDTISLEEAFIYPWPSRERFRDEFLELALSTDAYSIGQQRLDPEALYDRLMEVGRDGSEVYNYTVQQQAIQNRYVGQLPPNNLFNPIAWAKFLKSLRDR
ncbi:MAG: carboxypeptidase-like regulatory domain-containing protein [Flavobacteriales bacterium]|nr:carboxypeptidase-like regulatory domain-containing protein [Flavobacteriales bacterium]